MEEPQRDGAGAVGEATQQRTAAANDEIAELDDAFDQRNVADREATDRLQCRTVLVALRQQAQEIADPSHAELRQAFGHLRSDAREALDRPIERG